MSATPEAKCNEGLLVDVSRELYDFLVETIEGAGIGKINRGFDDLDKNEIAVFRVRSRLIVNKIIGGWK